MIEIPSTSEDAVALPKASAVPRSSNGPADKNFLDQNDLLGDDDCDGSTVEPEERKPGVAAVKDSDTRRTRSNDQTKPSKARSLSPIRRNPYAPQPDGQQPFRRSQTTLPGTSRQKSPNRTASNNVVRDMLEMVGIPLEEEVYNEDDSFDDYKVSESEIQTLINDREEFLRLKTALKAKGAVTNEMLRQRLHVYVHKNRDRLQNSDHHSAAFPRSSDCSENSNSSFWFGLSG